jgi:hypothetical protein
VIICDDRRALDLPSRSFSLCVFLLVCFEHFLLPEFPFRGPLSERPKQLARAHLVISEINMVSRDVDSSFDVQTPLLENMVVGVPPVFEGLTKQIDKIVEQPLLGPKTKFPAGETPNVIS